MSGNESGLYDLAELAKFGWKMYKKAASSTELNKLV